MSEDTTPRPWCEIETPHWTLGIGSLHPVKIVANIPAGSDTGAADRALIVRAVNAHDDLVKACEADLKAFELIATIVQQIRAGDTNAKNALDIIFDLASMPAAPLALAKVATNG